MKKLKFIIIAMFLCISLIGCSNDKITKYISITTTHATSKEGVFESDVYLYNIITKKISKKATLPYDSQYPLTTYDDQNSVIYYSRQTDKKLPYGADCLTEYSLKTNKEKMIVDYVDAFNNILCLDKQRILIVGQLRNIEEHTMVPTIFDKQKKKIIDFDWDKDQFVAAANYNFDSQEIALAHYSLKQKYTLMDTYNNHQISETEAIASTTISVIKDNQIRQIISLEKQSVDSIYSNDKYIYYTASNDILETNYELIRYSLQSKEKEVILNRDSSWYRATIIGIDENDLYFIGRIGNEKYQFVKYNLKTKDSDVIYEAKDNEAINNAQMYVN